uniref:Proteasome endopeptidase complex n=1 Tax=Populus trichocarpa TaxID=3694 RepID=B9ING7_POPTR
MMPLFGLPSPPFQSSLFMFGSTVIGLKTKEGVVLAVEKRITSPLLVCLFLLASTFHFIILHVWFTSDLITTS